MSCAARLIGRFWAWLREQGAAADHRGDRHRHRRRADQGHDGERQGADTRAASASSWRGAMRSPSSWPSCCGWPGVWLRPDYWWNLQNSFAILLELYRAGAAGDRPHLRHRQRRHRPVGRRGAGAGRRRDRLLHEGDGLRSVDRRADGTCWPAAPPGLVNALDHGRLRPALLHRHARHVLYRPRPRRLDRRRQAADRLSRELQPAGPQARSTSSIISASTSAPARCAPFSEAVSVQTLLMLVIAIIAGDHSRPTRRSGR